MFFPIGTDRPQRKFPWVNVLLILANVVIYVMSRGNQVYFDEAGIPHQMTGFRLDWSQYMLNAAHPQWWQFLTYQFLHQDLGHIFGNMVFLYVFGNNLNEKLGHIGYLLFYLTGGILAGCGQCLVSQSPTLGASGAISAVTGLFIVLLPRTHIKAFVWLFVFADVWEIPSMYFVLFNIGWDIVEPMLSHVGVGMSRVAHMAHVAGWIAGCGIGMLLLLGKLVQRDHYDLLAVLDRWRRRRQYEALVSRGYDPFAGARAVDRRSTAAAQPGPNPRIEMLRGEINRMIREHDLPGAVTRYLELKNIDTSQVLPAQDQLDVANQLMADGRYELAATAYEDYLRAYGSGAGRNEQVWLILGLIYARYLPRPERAREVLKKALEGLHDAGQRALAEGELAKLGGAGGAT